MSDARRTGRPGRPRRYREPRRDIHVSLPERLVEALDAAAGSEGRTAYIERLLREVLGIQEEAGQQTAPPQSS